MNLQTTEIEVHTNKNIRDIYARVFAGITGLKKEPIAVEPPDLTTIFRPHANTMRPKKADAPAEQIGFEASLAKLESLACRLENDDTDIEDFLRAPSKRR